MTVPRLVGLSLVIALGGCGASYVLGRVGDVAPPARPPDCRFEIRSDVPGRPFDELAILAPKDIEYGTMSGGAVPFQEAVQAQVCGVGGDAVVVEKDMYDHYVRGTVIKYR
jgi:hypothetical protein